MRNDFESNYLMHHGILGMKWGIRRYQNPDGSLTAAGRERYGVKEGGSVSDISTEKGRNRRIKDLNKAIKKNQKARGKEHSKIANNPENFLGLNKKHANKIEEYSENIRKGEAEKKNLTMKNTEEKNRNASINEVASKTHTWVGDADETYNFLAKNVLEELTDYGHAENVKNYTKAELVKTFHDAFGDDEKSQREALKLLYSGELTRFMVEESSDPLSSEVRRSNKNSDEYSSSNRYSDMLAGDSWGSDHADEWKGYMEDNVGHKIDSLTAEEKAQALKETGLYYDDEDLETIRKTNRLSHCSLLGGKVIDILLNN